MKIVRMTIEHSDGSKIILHDGGLVERVPAPQVMSEYECGDSPFFRALWDSLEEEE